MIEPGEKEAVEFVREEDPTLTCKQGACVQGHPLHCCHLSAGITLGVDLRTWECVVCGQLGKAKIRIKIDKKKRRGPEL